MPSPTKPSQFCAVVPAPSADICSKIKLVFLQLPALICDLVSWMLNEDGTPTSEFLADVSPLQPGDFKYSAVESPGMGFLYCNGQAVSRTTYAALFAAIGTTFGTGDGSTTFNVPDLRNRFLLGVSASKPLGTTGGFESVTLSQSQIPAHTHDITGYAVATTNSSPLQIIIDDDYNSAVATTKQTGSTGGTQSHSNMPPYMTVFIHIKY